jgi:hypothetical protein
MDPRLIVRFVRLVLILAAVALAAVPLLVLLDLAGGGDGYGLCPGGITRCRNPYSAAPQLSIALTVGLFVVLGGLRVTTHLDHRFRRGAVPPSPR